MFYFFFNPVSLRAQTEFSEGSGSNGILLVPVCLSAMLITLGSILIELVFIVLGQSAAIAASLAIDKEIAVQQLNYYELKKVLLNGKQRLQLALFSCPWDKFRMGLPK